MAHAFSPRTLGGRGRLATLVYIGTHTPLSPSASRKWGEAKKDTGPRPTKGTCHTPHLLCQFCAGKKCVSVKWDCRPTNPQLPTFLENRAISEKEMPCV